jgi:tetratricopeptide (TPR) repeat protein
VRLATKACQRGLRIAAYWNTLGVAHYRAGNWARAVEALGKAMALKKGGDGWDWFFLAMIYHRRGNAKVARQCLDRASGWMDRHRPRDAELRRFRAEAEALLGGRSRD